MPETSDKNDKTLIGWREYVDLPDWGIHHVRAKVDTGARSSALHVDDVEILKHNKIRFTVILSKKDSSVRKRITAKRLKSGRVKSSIGIKTERWFVETTLKMGKFKRKIVITLVDRRDMNFRMLLGRKALEEAFIVDVDKSFLLGKKKKIKIIDK